VTKRSIRGVESYFIPYDEHVIRTHILDFRMDREDV
jgi:hypothetical protein